MIVYFAIFLKKCAFWKMGQCVGIPLGEYEYFMTKQSLTSHWGICCSLLAKSLKLTKDIKTMLINSYHCPSGARPGEKKKKTWFSNWPFITNFINNGHIQNFKNTVVAQPSFLNVWMQSLRYNIFVEIEKHQSQRFFSA